MWCALPTTRNKTATQVELALELPLKLGLEPLVPEPQALGLVGVVQLHGLGPGVAHITVAPLLGEPEPPELEGLRREAVALALLALQGD